MPAIMDALRRDHENIEQLLKVLEQELDVFDRTERPDYEVVQAVVDYFRSYPDRIHHPKEDLVFEKLQQRDPQATAAIGSLEAEHEKASARLKEFATVIDAVLTEHEISRDAIDHVARDFIEHERRHMEMEERHFFPLALKILTPQDWAELDAKLTDEADPLFSDEVRQEFQALRCQIVEWEEDDQAERNRAASPDPA